MISITRLDRKGKRVYYRKDPNLTSEYTVPVYWNTGKWQNNTSIDHLELNKQLENYTQFDPEEINMKQKRYILDPKNNKDLIDKWSEKYNQQEFGIIMWAMIEKYQTRLGRKDSLISELTKMHDYMTRWLEVEKIRLQEKLNDSNS